MKYEKFKDNSQGLQNESPGSRQRRRSSVLCTCSWVGMLAFDIKVRFSNWTQWTAAVGCRWKAVWIRQSAAGLTAAAIWAAACCYTCTDVRHPPPSLSLSLLLINVSGCADADPSLLETRRESMVMSQLPLQTPSQAHDFLCRTQAPFVRPQVTHDPFSSRPPG